MKLSDKIAEINLLISQESWFDFEILNLKGNNLSIIGSIDFNYYHNFELIFEDVFHMSINTEWKSDTSEPVLHLVTENEAIELNKKYQIERGYNLFKIIPEDSKDNFYVAAKGLQIDNTKVYYYKKQNLGENEKIAHWVE